MQHLVGGQDLAEVAGVVGLGHSFSAIHAHSLAGESVSA